MRKIARDGDAAGEKVAAASWDTAFEMTYGAYRYCQETSWAVSSPLKKPALVRL